MKEKTMGQVPPQAHQCPAFGAWGITVKSYSKSRFTYSSEVVFCSL